MTWGPYWMFYSCPACGKKFRSEMDEITNPKFGKCPVCGIDGKLVAESKNLHGIKAGEYEITTD